MFDNTDRILIDLVDRAIRAGVGHSFASPNGQMVKVLDLGERWVRLEAPMGNPKPLVIPRDIRRIALMAADVKWL